SHCSNNQTFGLRPRIPTAADDQRNEQRQHNGSCDLLFEETHGSRCQHFSEKKSRKPATTFLDHFGEPALEIRSLRSLHTSDFLNVFAGFLVKNVADVIG